MNSILNRYLFHWSPEKAIYISGHPLLWDARCSGILVGIAIGLLWHLGFAKKANGLPSWPVLLLSTMMLIPMLLDLVTIWLGIRNASNQIRFLTGILFGGGVVVYIYPSFISLLFSGVGSGAALKSIPVYVRYLALCCFAFTIKETGLIITFYILQVLCIFGFIALAIILVTSLLKLLQIFVLNKGEQDEEVYFQ